MPRGKNLRQIPKIDFQTIPLMLNEEQCAEVCGVSVAFLRLARSEGPRDGRTPGPSFVRINGTVRYARDDILKWVSELPRRTAV